MVEAQQFLHPQPRLALISVHGDPATKIGQEEAGGQNVYVRQIGQGLARQGWFVDMFTRQTSPTQPAIVEHTPRCRTIRLPAGPAEFIPRDQIFEYLPEFVQQFLSFERQQNIQHLLLHTNYWLSSWVGLELKKRLSLPLVHTYHSLGAAKYLNLEQPPPIAATRLAVEKRCLETADRIVATSPQEQADMRSLVSEAGAIAMIPCGTDIQRFGAICRPTARQQIGLGAGTKMVLYVGRFDPRKGIETLVRAIAQSRVRRQTDLQLVIAGGSRPGQTDGRERQRIAALVHALGLEELTQFPGRLEDDLLPVYYAAADVCVVPSHYEPFGLVAIEAMASGTPVVASQVGGLQFTILPEVTGLLVPQQDTAGFATAIDRILMDPDWQQQLGQAGRKWVETEFSWEGVTQQLSQLYWQLILQPCQLIQPSLTPI